MEQGCAACCAGACHCCECALQPENADVNNEEMELCAPLNQWSNFYSDYLKDYRSGKDIRMFGMQKLILDNVRKMNDQYLHFSEQANRKLELYTVGKGLLSIVLKLAVYSYICRIFETRGADRRSGGIGCIHRIVCPGCYGNRWKLAAAEK